MIERELETIGELLSWLKNDIVTVVIKEKNVGETRHYLKDTGIIRQVEKIEREIERIEEKMKGLKKKL